MHVLVEKSVQGLNGGSKFVIFSFGIMMGGKDKL